MTTATGKKQGTIQLAVGKAVAPGRLGPRPKAEMPKAAPIQSALPPGPPMSNLTKSDVARSDVAKSGPAKAAPGQAEQRVRMHVESPQHAAAVALLKIQSEIREVQTTAEMSYLVVNAPRQLLRAQQIIFTECSSQHQHCVRAVSSVTQVDRSSPMVLWFEGIVAALDRKFGLSEPRQFEAGAFPVGLDSVASSYPLRYLLWVPWIDRNGQVVAGTLLARTAPWTSAELGVAEQLAAIFAHAWAGFAKSPWQIIGKSRVSRRTIVLAALLAAALLSVPVSMSALAPVEVAPRDAMIVTSGVEGVVKSVLVEPNQAVKKDQVLLRMVDTTLKNRFEIAEREVVVAETKYKKAAQTAFVDARGRHELGLAQAELGLKISERDYAGELLTRTEIKAEREGVAFFGDTKDLIGRPVAVGEKLMEIASPAHVEFRIDLGVADAIVLRDSARVKIFLDSDPLNPIEARLVRAGYQARVRENQQLAFRLVAEAPPLKATTLRLGVRGTAQIYSDTVPWGFYLFRRPITAARQWLGI